MGMGMRKARPSGPPLLAAPPDRRRHQGTGTVEPTEAVRRLRPGPGQDPEFVAADQSGRLRQAMVDLVYEDGYPNVTLAKLLSRAHVAKRDFYRLFSGKEDLFLSAYEVAATDAITFVEAATAGPGTRAEIVERGLGAFLHAISVRPADAYLSLLETVSVGPVATERMRRTEDEFVALIIRRLAATEDPVTLRPRVAYGLVAGGARLARERLETRIMSHPGDAEELLRWIVALSDPALAGLADVGVPRPVRTNRPRLTRDLRLPMSDERAILIRAVISLAATEVYKDLSPRRIAEAAGVPKRSFDAEFESVEDCVTRALEVGAVAIVADVRGAFREASDWGHGVRLALEELCRFLASEPGLARLAFVELYAAGRGVTRQGSVILSALARLLREGTPEALRPGPAAAEASIGAIWALLRKEVAAGRIAGISRLAPTLSWFVLAPAIGGPQAIEVLSDARIPRAERS
jgi:AcrR family transcriptional regulator